MQAEWICLNAQCLKHHRHKSCSRVFKAAHVITAIIIICSAPFGPRNAPNTVKSCLQKPLPSLQGKKFGNCFPLHNNSTPEQIRDEVCIQLKLEGGIKQLTHNYLIGLESRLWGGPSQCQGIFSDQTKWGLWLEASQTKRCSTPQHQDIG